MANTILVGAQWGDEGKGKIIDVLTEQADVVVRYAGGNNAGHTVFLGPKKYVLHLVPSGILRKDKLCVIGNGVVVDPIGLVEEITGLQKIGVKVTPKNFVLSETAHVVFPYHRELDAQREVLKGKNKIGTTKRGIGPAYGDKAARVGLRVNDLVDPVRLKEKLSRRIQENNIVLKSLGAKPLSFKKVFAEYLAAGEFLKPFVQNTVVLLHGKMREQADILFEGAQGTFLDIDHGTYPFVTSSNGPRRRRDEGLHHARRRRTVADGERGDFRPAARHGPRIRRDDRPRAALRLVRFRGHTPRDNGQRH
jgi:adenylosuccinate synthase